jgi:hypothetical protein
VRYAVLLLNLNSGMMKNNSTQGPHKVKQGNILLVIVLMAVIYVDGFGQEQHVIGNLIRKFEAYTTAVPREEIFVNTDREEYIAGEVLWFSAWLFDRQSSHLTSHSQISYVEVLNPYNVPVCQARVILDKGFGYGQLKLPDTLSNGDYSIRAYTSWMKNFLPENCFQKNVKIYNAFKRGPFKKKLFTEEINKAGSPNGSGSSAQALSFEITRRTADTLELVIRKKEQDPYEAPDSFYLFIQTHGEINYTYGDDISAESKKVRIPARQLIPGINHITLFNSGGHPCCERYIFTPDSPTLCSVSGIQEPFSTRNNKSIILNTERIEKGLDSMFLSVSIAPVTKGTRGHNATEYMIFGSEFGFIPGSLSNEVIDSLMPGLKSNWIDWQAILNDSLPHFSYLPENEVHFLSGFMLTGNDKPAPAGEYVLLSCPGKIPVFRYARTDDNGRFTFMIPIDEYDHELIIQPENNLIYKLSLESPFSGAYHSCGVKSEPDWSMIPPFVPDWSINYQVGRVYGTPQSGQLRSLTNSDLKKPLRFYGKPTYEIYLKNWAELSDMQEVFFEIVPGVSLRKKGSEYEMLMYSSSGKELFESPPVIMIDGVIIRNPALIAGLNPKLVEKIDVVKEQYLVGDFLFDGIVNVITVSADLFNLPLPDNAVRIQYRIIDPVYEFVTPYYSNDTDEKNHEPDFRNTLYWNPSLKAGNNGSIRFEFSSSDIMGDYEVTIQGISPGGKAASVRKAIKIEK